ncbi:hypothetical protein [Deinococcus rufus]|uniref:Uncharacterized protein n=1 Tax=Deinococcus rufus TaxID=2136097 RepID=A0ABV7Z9W8_9DEIO
MSRRRDRENAARRATRRAQEHALDAALAVTPDWPDRQRLIAQHERTRRGFIRLRDREPHYVCQLGLHDRPGAPLDAL